GTAGPVDRPGALVLRSRLELARGNYQRALELARKAAIDSRTTELAGQSLLNVSSLLGFSGFEDIAVVYAEQAITAGLPPAQERIAHASIAMWHAQHEGDLETVAADLRELAIEQDAAGHLRYAGITRVNLSSVLTWLGDYQDALDVAASAQVDLGGR